MVDACTTVARTVRVPEVVALISTSAITASSNSAIPKTCPNLRLSHLWQPDSPQNPCDDCDLFQAHIAIHPQLFDRYELAYHKHPRIPAYKIPKCDSGEKIGTRSCNNVYRMFSQYVLPAIVRRWRPKNHSALKWDYLCWERESVVGES